jgi:hypothetical protein
MERLRRLSNQRVRFTSTAPLGGLSSPVRSGPTGLLPAKDPRMRSSRDPFLWELQLATESYVSHPPFDQTAKMIGGLSRES